MQNKEKLLKLVITAFLISLEIILTRFLSVQLPLVRIGFGFLPVAVCGILCGPLWAAAGYAIGDILGVFTSGTGMPHPGFTISAFLTGLTFGLFLYKKEPTIGRVLLSTSIVVLIINLGLDTLWLSQLTQKGILAILPVRIAKTAIMFVLEPLLIMLIYKKVLLNLPLAKNMVKQNF